MGKSKEDEANNNNNNEKKSVDKSVVKDEEYIFEKIVGGSGWWQWRTTLITFPLLWIGGMPLFISVYAAYTPQHRCFIDQCDGPNSRIVEPYVEFAIPREHSTENILRSADDFDPCHKYVPLVQNSDSFSPIVQNEICLASSFNTSATMTCDKYVWDDSQMDVTLTTELNLVCGEQYKRRLFSTTLMAGLLLGSLIGGRVGDRLGRRRTLGMAAFVVVPIVVLSGFIVNFYAYLFFRLVTCTMLPIMWIAGHTYGLEYFSPDKRKLIICIKDFPIAGFIQVLLVYLNRHWSFLHLWTGVVCLLGIPCYFFIPESPRWMAMNGRKEEAEKVFHDIARTNSKKLTEGDKKEISDILDKLDTDHSEKLNFTHMFKRGHIQKTLILILCWVTVCIGYYALTFSQTKLNGDIVLNYLLLTLIDSPVCILLYFTLDGLGRRWLLSLSLGLLGASTTLLALIPKDYDTVILVTYLISKLAAGIGFMMVWLITAELYPTNLRAQAVGFCSMVARVFGLVAPFTSKLAVVWTSLPMLTLGIPSLIAAILALKLTETSKRKLPTTMADAQDKSCINSNIKMDLHDEVPMTPVEGAQV